MKKFDEPSPEEETPDDTDAVPAEKKKTAEEE